MKNSAVTAMIADQYGVDSDSVKVEFLSSIGPLYEYKVSVSLNPLVYEEFTLSVEAKNKVQYTA